MTVTENATARPLRTLYFARFGFALVWAALLALTGGSLDAVSTSLLVLYPLVDVAAAVVDLRSAKGSAAGLYANMALSLAAAVALAVAAGSGIPDVLRVWGVWAIVAGVAQLVVAIGRHATGGQWAQILSGGLSTVAGTAFILMAGGAAPGLGMVAGYAVVGGVFFLVSALRYRAA